MFKNRLLVPIVVSLVFANSSVATEKPVSENLFQNVIKCMENTPLAQKDYQGVSYQQIVLTSVLENLTKDKASTVSGLNVDYSEVYQSIVKHCPEELEAVKKQVNK